MKKIRMLFTPIITLTAILSTSLIFTGCSVETSDEQPSEEVENTLQSISVFKQPHKTVYYVGETFDYSGLEITFNYSVGLPVNAAIELIKGDCEFSPSGPLTISDDTITITYLEEFSTTVSITVCELTSISLTVDEDSLETRYDALETYDFSSILTLSGTYTDINGETVTTDVITDYSLVFKLQGSEDVEDLVCDVDNVGGFELANSTYTVYAQKDNLISEEYFEIEVFYDS